MTKELIPWQTLSEAYAFLGNSLLAPMSQTSAVGLDPAFWRAFPDFDDAGVFDAIAGCVRYAEDAVARAEEGGNIVQDASVEYTKLFIGPPSPSAAPWETMYRSDTNIGFGEATFQIKALLKAAGLEVKNENHQYEDHMGIELLYLSELCRRRAAQEADAADDAEADPGVGIDATGEPTGNAEAAEPTDSVAKVSSIDPASDASVFTFIETHPLSWVDAFRARIAEEFPEGYFVGLAGLIAAILRFHVRSIAR